MPLRFLYFDAGFTLIRPYPSVGHWYSRVASEYGVALPADALESAFRVAWKTVRRRYEPLTSVPYGRTEAESLRFWSDVVRETFLEAGHPAPESPAFFDDVFHLFAKGSCWRIYDDVEPALALLHRRGIPWGVLSNWDGRLRSVLRDLGLADRMAALVMSCEIGAEKPSPGIFAAAERTAQDLTGCARSDVALIGDEPRADAHGPRDAGWRHCLIYRDSPPPPSSFDGYPWAPDLVRAVETIADPEG